MTATVQERAIKATQIWENENRKINTGGANRRSLFIVTGVLIVVAALTIGLYVGLKKSTKTTSSDNNEIVAQAKASSYSLGCFVDERRSRVMPHVYTDLELTPSVSGECDRIYWWIYYTAVCYKISTSLLYRNDASNRMNNGDVLVHLYS